MEKGQKRHLLDQIFDAIDGNNVCKARYRLSEALDAQMNAPSEKMGTTSDSSPGVEGQA